MSQLKVFTSKDFTGIWPVGRAAVVVARDRRQARRLMKKACKDLPEGFDGTLQELDLSEPVAIVLNDGNY